MFRSLLFLFVLLPALQINVFSQSCAVKLRDAENLFSAGRVEEVPGLLQECLVSGFTKAEELTAYQLIIRSYLFDDKTSLAESTMFEFLKKNPEYEISPTDNADFVYLFNKFKVKPVIQLGLRGGINYTYILGKDEGSLSGDPSGSKYSNDNITLAFGGIVRYTINEKFEIGLELDYSEVSFTNTEEILSYAVANYREKQRRFETVLDVYYSPWKFGGFIPYFKSGFGIGYTLSAEAGSITGNLDVNNPFEDSGADVSRIDSRNRLDMLASLGFGLKYKLPSGYAFIDIDSRFGLRNQTIPGQPTNLELNLLTKDDPRFRLNISRVSLGYIFIIYKPVRLEN